MSAARELEPLTATSLLTVGSTTFEIREWAQAFDLDPRTVVRRLLDGWAPHDAVSMPSMTRVPDRELDWEDDLRCQRFVADHPHGADGAQIGEFFGFTRQRTDQILQCALRKLRATLERGAPEVRDHILARMAGS